MALIGRLIGPLLDGHFFAVEIPSRIIWMPSGGPIVDDGQIIAAEPMNQRTDQPIHDSVSL